MIPGSFDYHRPTTLAEAAALLARHGDEARLLAGGHRLIPMMKLRMATPAHLVDLQGIVEAKGNDVTAGLAVIGTMTTQHELITQYGLAAALPLIREAALQIADPQGRCVGTVGGNVANGDPGNDIPGLMQCLDASFDLVGPDGRRRVPARDFQLGLYETARAEDEILARIRIRIAVPEGKVG